ncbi:hypothetical protein EVAR_54734_1 [Eumeta japonica]|uniref:Uncharacterized protein n=1 Tax=Eumeta variegata TaxID=151549 RepID=A0A4C1YVN0_EUMVA|nr:hypothetical protein EVAR_54734_1 [Eumeta japonica]
MGVWLKENMSVQVKDECSGDEDGVKTDEVEECGACKTKKKPFVQMGPERNENSLTKLNRSNPTEQPNGLQRDELFVGRAGVGVACTRRRPPAPPVRTPPVPRRRSSLGRHKADFQICSEQGCGSSTPGGARARSRAVLHAARLYIARDVICLSTYARLRRKKHTDELLSPPRGDAPSLLQNPSAGPNYVTPNDKGEIGPHKISGGDESSCIITPPGRHCSRRGVRRAAACGGAGVDPAALPPRAYYQIARPLTHAGLPLCDTICIKSGGGARVGQTKCVDRADTARAAQRRPATGERPETLESGCGTRAHDDHGDGRDDGAGGREGEPPRHE